MAEAGCSTPLSGSITLDSIVPAYGHVLDYDCDRSGSSSFSSSRSESPVYEDEKSDGGEKKDEYDAGSTDDVPGICIRQDSHAQRQHNCLARSLDAVRTLVARRRRFKGLTDNDSATLPPPCCTTTKSNRYSRRCWIMTASALALIVVVYAVAVQLAWDRRLSRGRTGGHHHASLATKASGVQRHWVHSHNDEMHIKDALTLALSVGVGSVEVDTWLGEMDGSGKLSKRSLHPARKWYRQHPRPTLELPAFASSSHPLISLPPKDSVYPYDTIEKRTDKHLLIGHEAKDVKDGTLIGVYLDPILARLEENNKGRSANESVVGIYPDDPSAQVQIVIDMKNDGDEIWPYLLAAIEPLRSKGYITSYNTTSETWTHAPLIVIGTGNTPLHQVYHANPRVIFYDAPLRHLDREVHLPATPAGPAAIFHFDQSISPMASSKLPVKYHVTLAMPPWNPVTNRIRRHTTAATRRGISSRWWGAASNPSWVRRRVWEVVKEGGTTWTNADDVADAVRWLDGN